MLHDNEYEIITRYGKSVDEEDVDISGRGDGLVIISKLCRELLGNKHFDSIEIKPL